MSNERHCKCLQLGGRGRWHDDPDWWHCQRCWGRVSLVTDTEKKEQPLIDLSDPNFDYERASREAAIDSWQRKGHDDQEIAQLLELYDAFANAPEDATVRDVLMEILRP